jgi:hypothetical protein
MLSKCIAKYIILEHQLIFEIYCSSIDKTKIQFNFPIDSSSLHENKNYKSIVNQCFNIV